MAVILHERDWDTWMNAPAEEAVRLQQPWPDDELKIVTPKIPLRTGAQDRQLRRPISFPL
jgi:putative SOS response-associated peptidase YedK